MNEEIQAPEDPGLRVPVDIPVAVAVCALVGYILISTTAFPDVEWNRGGSPGFYPRILAILLTIFAASMVWKSRRSPTIAVFPHRRRAIYLISCIGGSVLMPLVLMPLLGFRIAAFMFMYPVMLAGRSTRPTRRDLLLTAGVAVLVTTIIYVAFVYLARVRLPRGAITNW